MTWVKLKLDVLVWSEANTEEAGSIVMEKIHEALPVGFGEFTASSAEWSKDALQSAGAACTCRNTDYATLRAFNAGNDVRPDWQLECGNCE